MIVIPAVYKKDYFVRIRYFIAMYKFYSTCTDIIMQCDKKAEQSTYLKKMTVGCLKASRFLL